LAVKSVNASESSAKAGERESSGNGSVENCLSLLKEPRETRRRGVVGTCLRVEEDWRSLEEAGRGASAEVEAILLVMVSRPRCLPYITVGIEIYLSEGI
jgi:hypothetical protein